MTEQQMPARIWCDTIDAALCKEKVKRSHTSYVRADLAERMAEALDGLVRINEDHNEAISQIIGRALNWKDGYLDQARSALSAFKSATKDTEARHD